MRTIPVAPTDVQPDTILWDITNSAIDGLDMDFNACDKFVERPVDFYDLRRSSARSGASSCRMWPRATIASYSFFISSAIANTYSASEL